MDDFSSKTIAEIKGLLDGLPVGERIGLFSLLEGDPRAGVQALIASHKSRIARHEAENAFQHKLLKYERMLNGKGFVRVAGVDEVGRGALAGPIVAAAAMLPRGEIIPGVRDSKKLSAEQREAFYERIIETAVCWHVARVEHSEIDKFGIQWANMRVLELAVRGLSPIPDYVLSDAFHIKALEIPHVAITKGDSLSLSIAAASIVAKVTRDRIMCEYHELYPQYGYEQHKGYGTPSHLAALEKFGASPIHRTCFAPVADYEQLSF